MSVKQMRGSLGLSKAHNPKLKAWLQKLVKQGKAVRKGSLYGSAALISAESHFRGQTHRFANFAAETREKTRNAVPGKKAVGYFTRNPKGFGFVQLGSAEPDLYISQFDQGSAQEGDKVEVEWLRKRGFRGRRKGRIVAVLERATRQVLARLEHKRGNTLALPVNPKSSLPPIVIPPDGELPGANPGSLVEIELLEPDSPHFSGTTRRLRGKVLRTIEDDSSLELGFRMIVHENSVRTIFPPQALKEAQTRPGRVCFDPKSGRIDQRQLDYVTIDGNSARDFDDAVCVEKTGEGYTLYVAIADVAHYVQAGTALDEEAYRRGTSVYFPSHAVPMLPEALSNDLCSLRPGVNRMTLTCEIRIDAPGNRVGYALYNSLIRSRARLVYEDVAAFLDKGSPTVKNPRLCTHLRRMHALMLVLEKKRSLRGSVQFEFAESVVEFDAESRMTGMSKRVQSCAMRIIEQFMIEANETVAAHCVKKRLPAMYRVHDPPDRVKLKRMQRTLWHFGIKVPLSDSLEPRGFNKALAEIRQMPGSEALQTLLLRSMALAVYRTRNQGHFGLAADFYTHFTSPIRRYPDLLVHRALKMEMAANAAVEKHAKQKPQKHEWHAIEEETALHCSRQERLAEKAESQSVELMKAIFLENHVAETFLCVILMVENRGIRVEIEPHGIDCFVPSESLRDDWYVFDEVRLMLQGQQRKRNVRIGQRLRLRLVRVDAPRREMEFELVRWE